jgi:hypothetical protein
MKNIFLSFLQIILKVFMVLSSIVLIRKVLR